MSTKGIPLSDAQLENFLAGYDSQVLDYNEIANAPSLLSLFQNQRYAFRVIFVPSDSRNIGHWVVLLNRNDKTFELYDPLGFPADKINEFINKSAAARKRTYLQDATAPGERLVSADIQFQDLKSNNCGRFVIHRILSAKLDARKYAELLLKLKEVVNLDAFMISTIGIPN